MGIDNGRPDPTSAESANPRDHYLPYEVRQIPLPNNELLEGWVEGVFDRFLTTARHRFDAVGVPSFPAAELLVFWGSVQMGYNGFRHNPIDYATAVECPILVLHGALDPWSTTAETNAIVEHIRGSKRMVEVPGVGHDMPYVYRAPDLWVQTVKQFLAQRVATSAP